MPSPSAESQADIALREKYSQSTPDPHPRLSIQSPSRILLASALSVSVGGFLGFAHGNKAARLRFRAEHAHRMPTTTAGWYLYHKTQNYRAAQQGIRDASKMGLRVGWWTAVVLGLEVLLDQYRGARGRDVVNTVAASATGAVWFSAWNRFSYTQTCRTAGYWMMFGFVYGGLQDVIGVIQGRQIGYVDFLRRRVLPADKSAPTTASPAD